MPQSFARFIVYPVLHKGSLQTAERGIEITDHVLPPSRLSVSVDRNDWEAGIAKIPGVKLTLQNTPEDIFGDGTSGHPDAIFKAGGWEGSRLDVLWGNTIIFTADLYAKSSKVSFNDRRVHLYAQSPSQRFRTAETLVDRIGSDESAQDFLHNLLADVPGLHPTPEVHIPIRIRDSQIVADGSYFSNRPIWDNLQEAARALSISLRISPDRRVIVSPSSSVNELDTGDLRLTNPSKFDIYDGTKRLINSVTSKIRVPDGDGGFRTEDVFNFDAESVKIWGERKITLELPFVNDRGVAELLSDEILSQNSRPRRLCMFEGDATDEMIQQLDLFQPITIVSEAQYVGVPPRDNAIFGQPLPRVQFPGQRFRGRILRYDLDLSNGYVKGEAEELP